MEIAARRTEEYWFVVGALPLQEDTRYKKLWNLSYDILDSVKTAIIIIFLLFTFLFRIVGVEGPSMEPTLHDNDWLVLSAGREKPKLGDIVVVVQPSFKQEPLIKRVIGVGGDVVDIDAEKQTVTVNGRVVNEPYIMEPIAKSHLYGQSYPKTVPEGYLFVMGDNRNNSSDSRHPRVGMVDERYVLGKALLRLFPSYTKLS